jgi:hypothetical protein
MSGYNTETINVQFLNQSFLDKIDQGMTKEAGAAMSAFVRQKLREDGFTRKILTPVQITASELDRQLTEEPTVIVEKEPDSVAANMPFLGRGQIRYFKGVRYPVTFQKIESDTFTKSKFELATYRTDIRTILQENSVKDLQEQEDKNFFANIFKIATDNSNISTIAGGFTPVTLMTAVKKLLAKKLPVGAILMSQAMYADLISQPATMIGSEVAGGLYTGARSLDNFFGYKIITTNKVEILGQGNVGTGERRAVILAPQEYLGQFYSLQDATVFLKTEADQISFKTYEAIGSGIGNVNGIYIADF